MTTNYSDAHDEMLDLFNVNWSTNSSAIVGYTPDIYWPDVEELIKPDGSKFFARISIQTVLEKQLTLGNCAGDPFKKHYESSGLIIIQLFAPKSLGTSPAKLKKLAELAKNSYRGKSSESGIWFRNVRINELPKDNLFNRCNVIAEYEYDELA
jgi:hypothetical protein